MTATALTALADRLARLAPCHRDPHRYYEEKSEIVDQLRRLANSGQNFPSIQASTDTQTQNLRLRPSGKIPEAANDNHQRAIGATSYDAATIRLRAAQRQE